MTPEPADIFEVFTADHNVEVPRLPVTELVRLDTPSLYAIHDAGLIGTGECLYVGRTKRPFEELYSRYVTPDGPFRKSLREDSEAESDLADQKGGSNYLYENTRVSVLTVEGPDRLAKLETAAIGRLGPRYNERTRYKGGYLDLDPATQTHINELVGGELVSPKVGGTYALIALGIPDTEIERGAPLKTGRTDNLISRLNDHVRNTRRASCLRYKLESEFPGIEWDAQFLRSRLAVTFTDAGNYESEWQTFFNPRYPE